MTFSKWDYAPLWSEWGRIAPHEAAFVALAAMVHAVACGLGQAAADAILAEPEPENPDRWILAESARDRANYRMRREHAFRALVAMVHAVACGLGQAAADAILARPVRRLWSDAWVVAESSQWPRPRLRTLETPR